MTPQMVTVIVGTTIQRFPVNDLAYLTYMIGKLSTETPSIDQHRANVRAYLEYQITQKRIKEHELSLYRKAAANKKTRSKRTVGSSCVCPETWEAIENGEKEREAIKETNRKETARKKAESGKKKAAAAAKKEAAAVYKVANAANAANAAAAETRGNRSRGRGRAKKTNNRKGKESGHSENIEDPAEAIHRLFNNEAEEKEKDDVVD